MNVLLLCYVPLVVHRADILGCADKEDFLAKLHCVRLAFDEIVKSSANRQYFTGVCRDLISNFLVILNQDTAVFHKRFRDLTEFVEDESGWERTVEELTKYRKVRREGQGGRGKEGGMVWDGVKMYVSWWSCWLEGEMEHVSS